MGLRSSLCGPLISGTEISSCSLLEGECREPPGNLCSQHGEHTGVNLTLPVCARNFRTLQPDLKVSKRSARGRGYMNVTSSGEGLALFWKMENQPEVIRVAVFWDSHHVFVSFSSDIIKAGTHLASINSNLILTQVGGGVKVRRWKLTLSSGGHTCRASRFPAVGAERCHYVETQVRSTRSADG